MKHAGACLQRGSFLLLIAASAWVVGCGRDIEFPVPRQKVMPPGPDPLIDYVLKMSDPNVETSFVRDILRDIPGSRWRWTSSRPRFRLSVDSNDALTFRARFTVPAPVLARHPRVCITFVVNSTQVGSRCYSEDASYVFEAPAGALTGGPVEVGLDIDPVLISGDGVPLGVLVEEIGLKRTAQ